MKIKSYCNNENSTLMHFLTRAVIDNKLKDKAWDMKVLDKTP